MRVALFSRCFWSCGPFQEPRILLNRGAISFTQKQLLSDRSSGNDAAKSSDNAATNPVEEALRSLQIQMSQETTFPLTSLPSSEIESAQNPTGGQNKPKPPPFKIRKHSIRSKATSLENGSGQLVRKVEVLPTFIDTGRRTTQVYRKVMFTPKAADASQIVRKVGYDLASEEMWESESTQMPDRENSTNAVQRKEVENGANNQHKSHSTSVFTIQSRGMHSRRSIRIISAENAINGPSDPGHSSVTYIQKQQRRAQHTQAKYSANPHLPLAGIRVLDMTRVLAGPYCTQILGDHGAEIIKVEHPTRGDDTRAWGPPYAPYSADSQREGPGEAAYFLAANRNKKSIGLSFQDKRGVRILYELVKSCDVLVENYLPGSLKKYGLDYKTMSAINPKLIYVSITGYGQTGPYSNRAGYDVMVEAEFGLMHITGERNGPPVKVGVAITDLTTGLYACNATMASLLGRAKTGKGEHVDVALSDCQTASLANIASSALITGKKDSGRWGTAHPSIVPYKGFKTADGDILIGGGNDKLFGIMCRRIEKEEWILDDRFVTNEKRVENRQELERLIEETTKTKTTQQWLDTLEGSGMPYAAINDVQQTLQHEHTKARQMVTEVQHQSCGPMKLLSPPVKYLNSMPSVRLPPPVLGEHTDEILTDLLRMPLDEIQVLKGDGVIS